MDHHHHHDQDQRPLVKLIAGKPKKVEEEYHSWLKANENLKVQGVITKEVSNIWGYRIILTVLYFDS